ncbi:hypothetical protein CDAR_98711 [Caerostris darwini]|uniref:Reverse transcriptase RNase H-like domain-containing protein n=1 Tax=Caerostris darwini TaxID=1538125 RepID=A0AAV4Q425_9ARAC|nr:hypothetical protein CDAR_98711 [Caerostris darwini]
MHTSQHSKMLGKTACIKGKLQLQDWNPNRCANSAFLQVKSKMKKIMRWRLQLACFKFDRVYRPGKTNIIADILSRITASTTFCISLGESMNLCHPGITKM